MPDANNSDDGFKRWEVEMAYEVTEIRVVSAIDEQGAYDEATRDTKSEQYPDASFAYAMVLGGWRE